MSGRYIGHLEKLVLEHVGKLFPEEPELDGCSSVKMIFKTEISFVLGLIEL